MRKSFYLLLLSLCLLAGPAHAADDVLELPTEEKERPTRTLAVTVSPVHLVIPLVELMGEYKVDEKVSAAGILGYGQVSGTGVLQNGSTQDIDIRLIEVGAQLAYYLLGDFDDGIHVGIEGMALSVKAEASQAQATGGGLTVGGFVGVKGTADFGLVGLLQIGAQVARISAAATNSQGDTVSMTQTEYGALVNLNVGWAF